MADESGNKVNKYQLYQVEGDKPVRQKQTCPRCGQGVFLGEHADRKACGRCGYTEMSSGSNQESAAPSEAPSEQSTEVATEEAPKEEKPEEKTEEKQEEAKPEENKE